MPQSETYLLPYRYELACLNRLSSVSKSGVLQHLGSLMINVPCGKTDTSGIVTTYLTKHASSNTLLVPTGASGDMPHNVCHIECN